MVTVRKLEAMPDVTQSVSIGVESHRLRASFDAAGL